MIAVVGASGLTGSAVVERLHDGGHDVRALTRRPERAVRLRARQIPVQYAALTDPKSREAAMVGVQTVVTTAHAVDSFGRHDLQRVDIDGNRTLFKASERAGEKRFVFTSGPGVTADSEHDFYRAKALAERALRATTMEWRILRPYVFMDTWAMSLGEALLVGHRWPARAHLWGVYRALRAGVASHHATDEGAAHDVPIWTITTPIVLTDGSPHDAGGPGVGGQWRVVR